MQRVFVLNKEKEPLMPAHPARARQLLRAGRAAVYKFFPYTIILTDRLEGEKQPLELKFDPGSKTSGIAIVVVGKNGRKVVWAANLRVDGYRYG